MEGWNRNLDSLKDLKESNPVEIVEHARAKGIDDEAAFAWWVPHTIRKRDIIISKLKATVKKTTHKHDFEILRNVQHACDIVSKR